jgi:tetratricopeptide (TPR) repeat protein
MTEANGNRRKFNSDWDEILYLRDKVLTAFYGRGDRRDALRFCGRLERLLRKADPKEEAILGAECRALLWEVRGDLDKAIRYREHEITLIKRLRRISARSPVRDWVLAGYGISDLSDRLDLLAILYHNRGDLRTALNILRRSKRLCQAHGEPFDGQDLLDEYAAEARLGQRPSPWQDGMARRRAKSVGEKKGETRPGPARTR